jgi:hypothetical protein
MNTEEIINLALAGKQNLKDRIYFAMALEREECAKVCEKRADRYVKTKGYMFSVGAQDCADHIRARGNHEDR